MPSSEREGVQRPPYGPLWLYADAGDVRDLVVEWVADDGVDVFPLKEPVVARLTDADGGGSDLVASVDVNRVSVAVPALPEGVYTVVVLIDGDRPFVTAELTVRAPNPDLPSAPWKPFTVTGPAYFPGWWDEGGGGGAGPTGPEGPTGPPGLAVTGPTGPAGPTGQSGTTGPTGPTGAAGAGGSVDWANVPGPVMIKGAAGTATRVTFVPDGLTPYGIIQYDASKQLKFDANGLNVLTLSSGSAAFIPPITGTLAGSYKTSNVTNPAILINMAGIKFGDGAAAVDTTLTRASVGELTINDKVIQVAATRDGQDVGIPELLDMIDALKAEIAELRRR